MVRLSVYSATAHERSTRLVEKWLTYMGHFDPTSGWNVEECYEENRHRSRNSNVMKVEWIVTSDDFFHCLDEYGLPPVYEEPLDYIEDFEGLHIDDA